MKTAIVHYWLVSMRGGEKVLEALLEMFPDADVFTHVYNPRALSPVITNRRVYTSSINRLPFACRMYQKYMPLMPSALNEFDLSDYDLVLSSEAGPAKGVVPAPDAYHLCYCHSPMRYLWDMYHEYFRGAGPASRAFMKALVPRLRLWDASSANLVDRFVTNSSFTARRIMRAYNRKADVVPAPVDAGRFLCRERKPEDFYLFFGQLVNYKRADIAVKACVESGRRLVVAGGGSSRELEKLAAGSPRIAFLGRVSDEEAASLFSRARALVFPGVEDMGLVPVEAAAAGLPVVAFGKGGALDTVREGVTGLFFHEQTPACLSAALTRFEAMEGTFSDRASFAAWVARFSRDAFKTRLAAIIAERLRV